MCQPNCAGALASAVLPSAATVAWLAPSLRDAASPEMASPPSSTYLPGSGGGAGSRACHPVSDLARPRGEGEGEGEGEESEGEGEGEVAWFVATLTNPGNHA